MTNKEFFKRVSNSADDFLQLFIDVLQKNNISFCVIGGLGVNAYVEPVVSLDLDIIVVTQEQEVLIDQLKGDFEIEKFPHSINISKSGSDLRIQIQTDVRYQAFLVKANIKNVLGYQMPVACIEDVMQGKIWAVSDESRRPSKRQKDLADIMRLIEVKQELRDLLPEKVKGQLLI